MIFFKILWGIDAILALVAIYFFIDGLRTATHGSKYLQTWLVLLLVLGGILGGSLLLKNNNHLMMAKLLLSVVAIPGLLYGLFILLALILKPRWN